MDYSKMGNFWKEKLHIQRVLYSKANLKITLLLD
jgi:hypothetical protein